MVNGILYLNKTGCQWRMIPHEFGNWSTIYGYFKRWRCNTVWASLMETLRQWERRCQRMLEKYPAGQLAGILLYIMHRFGAVAEWRNLSLPPYLSCHFSCAPPRLLQTGRPEALAPENP